MKIATGIVTYNPEIKRLKENLDAVCKQTELIFIFDNCSHNIQAIDDLISHYDTIKVIKSGKNIGIAGALNRIFEEAIKLHFTHVLTLDQDSICPDNIISEYKKNLTTSVGILTPRIKDIHLNEFYSVSNKDSNEVERCITSAALTSINAWKSVNGYDEDMFIDCVDFDFCDRIRRKEFKIIRVNNVVLLHEIGNITKHHIGPVVIKVKNHSAFRKYYIARNTIYLARKHGNRKEEIKSVFQGIKQILLVAMFEDQKMEKIHSLKNGMHDGIKMPINKKWA